MNAYDGETLAFVEVRNRTAREDRAALPELSVTAEKQQVLGTAVAIEEVPGSEPVVRLH